MYIYRALQLKDPPSFVDATRWCEIQPLFRRRVATESTVLRIRDRNALILLSKSMQVPCF